jgi:hypothetical protein
MEKIAATMVIWAILSLSLFVIWIASLIDCIKKDFEAPNNKIIWIIILLVIPPLGGILYMLMEREKVCVNRKPEIAEKLNDDGNKYFYDEGDRINNVNRAKGKYDKRKEDWF